MSEPLQFMSVSLRLVDKGELWNALGTASRELPVRIATVNPEFILEAQRNTQFRQSLAEMTHCTIDGSGLLFALKAWQWFGGPRRAFELYHGSDLVEDLFRNYADGSKRFFFLGGFGSTAAQAAETLKKRYPDLQIVGSASGGVLSRDHIEVDPVLVQEINQAKPDILLINFSSPKQELWLHQAKHQLKVPVSIGVGGTLEFYTKKPRAPRVIRLLHLEWLFRSLVEPGHWKRAFRAVVLFPLNFLHWVLVKKAS